MVEKVYPKLFLCFFSDFMISLPVEQTNLYATRYKTMQTFKTDDAEMKKIWGLWQLR